jgi:hypothetical protein
VYNKIFTKILDSSIWLEPDATRIVWLTCIAAMDEDGFCCFASPANLAHRANVSLPACISALETLEGPDLNSSDPANDGRRLERVPGGWMVLNCDKYREIITRQMSKESNRARVARFRKNVGGQTQWNAIRAEMLAESPMCSYCKQEPATEIDHIVPISKGGTNDRDNLTPACRKCNTRKGAQMKWSGNGRAAEVMQSDTDTDTDTDTEAETKRPSRGIDKDHATEALGATVRASDELFGMFWEAYPRKAGKPASEKAFAKVRPSGLVFDAILKAIEAQKRSAQWTKDGGQFIPYPATWLNQRRWEDELPEDGQTLSYQPKAHADYDRWPEECRRDHDGECGNYQAHKIRLMRDEERRTA